MQNSDTLLHYGILGMKWGIRRTPEQLGRKSLKKAKTSNLDKWGKDPDHNILWVTGLSGSGKSTLAVGVGKKNDRKILLDMYFDAGENPGVWQNKEFNKYLDEHMSDWRTALNRKAREDLNTYWKSVDEFTKNLQQFGKDQFGKGNRVVAEGVQIAESYMFDNPGEALKDQPLVIIDVGIKKAIKQRYKRDVGTGKIGKEFVNEYMKIFASDQTDINDLITATNAKRGSDWVKQYLKEVSE